MLPHPQATSTDHGGPRTSDLSIERRRRNHFTTAPPFHVSHSRIFFMYFSYCFLKHKSKLKKKHENLFFDITFEMSSVLKSLFTVAGTLCATAICTTYGYPS